MDGDVLRVPVLEGCARCGGSHSDLELKPFTEPITFYDCGKPIVITHFVMCPRLIEPVLVQVDPDNREVTFERSVLSVPKEAIRGEDQDIPEDVDDEDEEDDDEGGPEGTVSEVAREGAGT